MSNDSVISDNNNSIYNISKCDVRVTNTNNTKGLSTLTPL